MRGKPCSPWLRDKSWGEKDWERGYNKGTVASIKVLATTGAREGLACTLQKGLGYNRREGLACGGGGGHWSVPCLPRAYLALGGYSEKKGVQDRHLVWLPPYFLQGGQAFSYCLPGY